MIKDASPEILVLIFKNLPKKNLRKSISLVCKQWHKLVYDFRLIDSNVLLKNDFDSYCRRLLKDLKAYPTFGPKIKAISIEEQDVVDASGFTQLIESCPNVEQLNVRACRRSNILMCISSQLFSPETSLQTKLKKLDIDYIDLGKYREYMDERFTEEIDISKLMNETMPGLQELSIVSPRERQQRKRFCFVKNGPDGDTNRTLESIVIESPYSTMTRDCLESLISGNFTKLENLNLFMRLAKDQGERSIAKEVKKDAIWDKLKQFCSTSLKNYNICFRDNTGAHLFSVNNCAWRYDVYEQENAIDFIPSHHNPTDSEGDSVGSGCALDAFLDAVDDYEESRYYFGGCVYD